MTKANVNIAVARTMLLVTGAEYTPTGWNLQGVFQKITPLGDVHGRGCSTKCYLFVQIDNLQGPAVGTVTFTTPSGRTSELFRANFAPETMDFQGELPCDAIPLDLQTKEYGIHRVSLLLGGTEIGHLDILVQSMPSWQK